MRHQTPGTRSLLGGASVLALLTGLSAHHVLPAGSVSPNTDVLRAQASNLTTKGLLKEGLKVDQKLVQVRPADPTAHYNLACRYALMRQPDLALTTLRKAVELGYRDFRYMIQDRDLDSIRKDPRFRDLLLEYGTR